MSKLQEIFLENCNRAVVQYKIDDFYSSYLAMGIIMISFVPVTIILNAVTVYVFWKEKQIKTLAETLLCFLAITDILGGFLAMPFFAVENILRARNIDSPCSIFLTWKIVGFFSVNITLVTSILIVSDRYCSIFHPYGYEARKNQTSFAVLVVVSSWCVCLGICLLSTITSKYLLAIIFIFITDISFVVLSIIIHLRILTRVRQIQRDIAIKGEDFERYRSKIKSWHRIKGARITAVILSGIFICYAPQIITAILIRVLNYSRSSLIAFHWTTGLLLFNSIVNPLLYVWQMKWFRKALWNIRSKPLRGWRWRKWMTV